FLFSPRRVRWLGAEGRGQRLSVANNRGMPGLSPSALVAGLVTQLPASLRRSVTVLFAVGVLLNEIAVILLHLPLLSPSPAILVLRSNLPLCGVPRVHTPVVSVAHPVVVDGVRISPATPNRVKHVAFISPAIIVEVEHDYHPLQVPARPPSLGLKRHVVGIPIVALGTAA